MAHDVRSPHIFVDGPGNTASGDQVMDNFDALWVSGVDPLAQPGRAVTGGKSVNSGTGNRTNVAYGALSDAADQVAGLVVPANAIIAIGFQAAWFETVAAAARAAIFIGANQLKYVNGSGSAGVAVQECGTQSAGSVSSATLLGSSSHGLVSEVAAATAYPGHATTGQVLGAGEGTDGVGIRVGFGLCHVFVAAGTYTISVQYKASSGTVSAIDRRLWVSVLGGF